MRSFDKKTRFHYKKSSLQLVIKNCCITLEFSEKSGRMHVRVEEEFRYLENGN